MATFYLLPSRPVVGERFATVLRAWLPGLHCTAAAWPELAEGLGSLLNRQTDSYVVFRDDLPFEEDPARALIDGFGAEDGDEVVEVNPGGRPEEVVARRWHVRAARAA